MSTTAWHILAVILIYFTIFGSLLIGLIIGRYTDFDFLDEDKK